EYAAVYYPWLRSTYVKEIDFAQLSFVDDQDPPVPIPDAAIDSMTGNPVLDGLVTTLRSRLSEEERVFSKVSEVTLNRWSYSPLSDHFASLRASVMTTILAGSARIAFSNLMSFVRELALAFRDLENDAENSMELTLQLSNLEANSDLQSQL